MVLLGPPTNRTCSLGGGLHSAATPTQATVLPRCSTSTLVHTASLIPSSSSISCFKHKLRNCSSNHHHSVATFRLNCLPAQSILQSPSEILSSPHPLTMRPTAFYPTPQRHRRIYLYDLARVSLEPVDIHVSEDSKVFTFR